MMNRNLYESPEGYYKLSSAAEPQQIPVSNFIIMVKAKIKSDSRWAFECIVKAGDYEIPVMLFQEDFVSSSAFKMKIMSDPAFEYYGNNTDTTQLMGLLNDKNPPNKIGVAVNGVHTISKRPVYVEGSQAIDKDGPVDDTVFIGNQKPLSRILEQADITHNDLECIAKYGNKFNDHSITYACLGLIGYYILKPRIKDPVSKHNPVGHFHGEPGSGKSETLLKIFQSIFSMTAPIKHVADMTPAGFAYFGCQSNMFPPIYDEYKLSLLGPGQIKLINSVVGAAYGQSSVPRYRNGIGVCDSEHIAPLIIAGEMSLTSPSLMHRIFGIYFSRNKKKGYKENFVRLTRLPLGAFGKGLVKHMLSLSDQDILDAFDYHYEQAARELDDRFLNTAILMRMGLWLVINYFTENRLDVSHYLEGFDYIDNAVLETMLAAQETNIDKMIMDFSAMANTTGPGGFWLNKHQHYEVKGDTLYLKIAEVLSQHRRFSNSHHCEAEKLSGRSFNQQLKEAPYYLKHTTVRIGNSSCWGVKLDLQAMPDHMHINFLDQAVSEEEVPAENDRIDDTEW